MERAALMDPFITLPSSPTHTRTQLIPKPRQILAGDPKQLGPSSRSPLVSQLGLAKSLQEHLMDTRAIYKNGASAEGVRTYIVQLRKNYRSHEVSERFKVGGAERNKEFLIVLDLVEPLSTLHLTQAIVEVPSTLFYERSLEQRGDPSIINSMLDFEMLPGAAPASSPTAGLPISSPLSRGGKDGGGFPILVYGVQGEHMHEVRTLPAHTVGWL